MATLYNEQDDPEMGEVLWDLSRRVTILVSYDPESDTLILDRGRIPRVMADGIVARITEAEFAWSDQADVPVEEEIEEE